MNLDMIWALICFKIKTTTDERYHFKPQLDKDYNQYLILTKNDTYKSAPLYRELLH